MEIMPETIATALVYLLGSYIAIGLVFAAAFVSRGVQKVDHQASGTGIGFRLLIFPGSAVLWPLLLRRWLRANGESPEERNPHR
jgi:hypothetical protein